MWIGSFVLAMGMSAATGTVPTTVTVPTLGDLADRQAAYVLAQAHADRAEALAASIGKNDNGVTLQTSGDAKAPTLRRVFDQAGQTHAVIQWPDGRITDTPVGTRLRGGYRTAIQHHTVVLLDSVGQPVRVAGAARNDAQVNSQMPQGMPVPDGVDVPPPPEAPPLGGDE